MNLNKKNKKLYLANQNLSIKECLIKLERSTSKILCFTKKKKLIGIINDGDIRRSILKGISTDAKVSQIINRKPIVADHSFKLSKIKDLFVKFKIDAMPIIKKGEVIDIITFDEILYDRKLNTDVIIMAGGFGKRLLPLTQKIPKALVKVNNKPIIDYSIERFKKFNLHKINLVTYHYHHKIKKYLSKKYSQGIKFFKESRPLGTSGGLSLLNKKEISENFIITNCDVISGINYDNLLNYHIQNNSDLTIVSYKKIIPLRYGKLEFEKPGFEILQIDEKPIIEVNINAGIYVMNKSCLKFIKKKKQDMPNLFGLLKKKNYNIKIFPLYEYWYDIGTHQDLKLCRKFLKKI